MRTSLPGANVAVFLLFFGAVLFDAVHSHDWIPAAFWVAVGLAFLLADLRPGRGRTQSAAPASSRAGSATPVPRNASTSARRRAQSVYS
jgi:hypothetical protein